MLGLRSVLNHVVISNHLRAQEAASEGGATHGLGPRRLKQVQDVWVRLWGAGLRAGLLRLKVRHVLRFCSWNSLLRSTAWTYGSLAHVGLADAYPHEAPRLCHRLDYGTSGSTAGCDSHLKSRCSSDKGRGIKNILQEDSGSNCCAVLTCSGMLPCLPRRSSADCAEPRCSAAKSDLVCRAPGGVAVTWQALCFEVSALDTCCCAGWLSKACLLLSLLTSVTSPAICMSLQECPARRSRRLLSRSGRLGILGHGRVQHDADVALHKAMITPWLD